MTVNYYPTPYPIELVPGQAKVIQLLNPNGSVYEIPAGTTISAKAVDSLKTLAFVLTATIETPNQGLIKITLPDNSTVRGFEGRTLFYDFILVFAGGSFKVFPTSTLNVLFSPTRA